MVDRKTVLLIVAAMSVLTIAYIAYVAYSATNNEANNTLNPVYYAIPYKGEPSQWYYPEELAIIDFLDNDENFDNGFWIVVDRDRKPFDLQAENPVFKLNEKFYQVSSLWVTPTFMESGPDIAVVGGAVGISIGWFATGMMYYRWLKYEKAV